MIRILKRREAKVKTCLVQSGVVRFGQVGIGIFEAGKLVAWGGNMAAAQASYEHHRASA